MLPNILTRLKESKKPTDYERNLTGAALSFCNVLSESILSISPDVHEDFAKATIKYKIGNYNFASIKPQVKKVVVRPLHIEYSEERDPKKLCRNISELKYSQSKPSEKDEVRIDFQKLSDFEDPQYAMNFIKIAYDKLRKKLEMPINNARVHICFGELEKDFEKLKSDALMPSGKVFDWWNVTHSARPGDLVLFYIIDPIKAFVATARIDSICECPDKTSKWKDKPCAWLRDAQMLPQEVTRDQARKHFPEWRYLNRMTATCIPNDTTPPDLVDRLLELLEVGNLNTVFEQELTEMWLPAEEADQASLNENEAYSPQGDDRRLLVERQIRERRGQGGFRNSLRNRYGDRCLITGCDVLDVLEAAHISPYRGEEDNHPENGLLLRSDIHTLFDLDLLGIEPVALRVELHPDVSKEYGQFGGKIISCEKVNQPSRKALQQRYELFKRRRGEVTLVSY